MAKRQASAFSSSAAPQSLPQLFAAEGITVPAVQNLVVALQDCGAYVVDAESDNLSFYAEPEASEAAGLGESQLARLLPRLLVITTSAAAIMGGGGVPRRCFAPDVR